MLEFCGGHLRYIKELDKKGDKKDFYIRLMEETKRFDLGIDSFKQLTLDISCEEK